MKMNFFINKSDRKKINKSLGGEVEVTTLKFKSPCDILRPVVEVARSSIGDNWSTFNYAYIEPFHRYYFIDKVTVLNSDLVEYSLTVDPLYTYKRDLLNTSFEVVRSESKFCDYYADPELYLQVYRTIEPVTVGHITQDTGASDKTYYLTVAGGTGVTP